MQDLDTDGADKALEPAFAAINARLHKQQPSACGGNCSSTQLPFFLRYSSAWVYAAMATTGVSLMEKRKQWQQAVDLLQQLLGESLLTLSQVGFDHAVCTVRSCYGTSQPSMLCSVHQVACGKWHAASGWVSLLVESWT